MAEYNKIKVYDYLSLSKLVAVQTVKILKDTEYEPESHDFWEFIYVRSGTLELTIGDQVYTMNSSSIIFYPPDIVHSWKAKTTVCFIDVLSFESNAQEMNYFYKAPIRLCDYEIHMIDKIFSEAEEVLTFFPQESPIKGQTLKSEMSIYRLQHLKKQIELFLIEIFNRTTPFDAQDILNFKREKSVTEANEKIIKCLTENIEKPLNLEQISKLTGISVTHMKRTFKKQHDGGIIDYFILMKIDEAKRMITETELSFTEISDSLGFGSSAYFSRTFKNKTGLTPSGYLKKVTKIAEDEEKEVKRKKNKEKSYTNKNN